MSWYEVSELWTHPCQTNCSSGRKSAVFEHSQAIYSWFHGYCTTGDYPERRAICDNAGNSHTQPTFLTLLQPPFDRKPRFINLFFGQWAMSDGDIFLDSLLGAHLPWKWLRETIGPKQCNTDMSKKTLIEHIKVISMYIHIRIYIYTYIHAYYIYAYINILYLAIVFKLLI